MVKIPVSPIEAQTSKLLFDTNDDVTWFNLLVEMNRHFKSKRVPLRFTYIKNDNTVVISRRYPVALYLAKEKRLYRIHGSLQLQWNMVQHAFIKIFGELTVIQ